MVYNQRVEEYQAQLPGAEDENNKTPTISLIINVISYLVLLVIFILASRVLFASADETVYVANRETFYTVGFICTVLYFILSITAHKITSSKQS